MRVINKVPILEAAIIAVQLHGKNRFGENFIVGINDRKVRNYFFLWKIKKMASKNQILVLKK